MKKAWPKNITTPQYFSEFRANLHKSISRNANNTNNNNKSVKSEKRGSGTSYKLLSQNQDNRGTDDISDENSDSEEDIVDRIRSFGSKQSLEMAHYGSYFTEVSCFLK